MLYSGGGGDVGTNTNQFKTAVIDTIVAEVQSVPGEDRCVLLLGYKDQIVDMFQVRLESRHSVVVTTEWFVGYRM